MAEMVELIDNRCELIVESGLVEETIYLLANGMEDWTAGARAVGYKQAIEYLKADWFTTKTRSVQGQRRKFVRFVQQYQAATRRFARKQQAWFRNKEPNYWWMVRNQEDDLQMLADAIADKFLEPEWDLPSAEVHQQRADADRLSVQRMQMGKHQSVNILYADQDMVDQRIDSIRRTLVEFFPELELEEEVERLAFYEAERVRKQGRRMADRFDRDGSYGMDAAQSRGARGPRYSEGSEWSQRGY